MIYNSIKKLLLQSEKNILNAFNDVSALVKRTLNDLKYVSIQ